MLYHCNEQFAVRKLHFIVGSAAARALFEVDGIAFHVGNEQVGAPRDGMAPPIFPQPKGTSVE